MPLVYRNGGVSIRRRGYEDAQTVPRTGGTGLYRPASPSDVEHFRAVERLVDRLPASASSAVAAPSSLALIPFDAVSSPEATRASTERRISAAARSSAFVTPK